MIAMGSPQSFLLVIFRTVTHVVGRGVLLNVGDLDVSRKVRQQLAEFCQVLCHILRSVQGVHLQKQGGGGRCWISEGVKAKDR